MDLEDELKRLFQDDRLDVRVAADAEQTVVAGARRVRRRRIALVSAAGVLSVAVVATGTILLTRTPVTTDTADVPPIVITTTTTSSPTESTTTSPIMTAVPDPPSAARATPPTIRPSNTTKTPAAQLPVSDTVLGPTGYGPFHLGMTNEQVLATGKVTVVSRSLADECSTYSIGGQADSVLKVAPRTGLVVIDPTAKVRTGEGIGVGATEAQVKAEYPDYDSRTGLATVPGNSAAWYAITLQDGKVSELKLLGSQSECGGG